MQLLGDDRKLHLLREERRRNARRHLAEPTGPSYNGGGSGSRYSTLTQINKSNAASLAPKWMFSLRNTNGLQVTPIVSDGVMYVTSANECYALDAGIGPRDLALPARAHEGPGRQRGRRRQSRRVGRRRSALHGDRPRSHHRAQQIHRRAALGNRDGRLAPELQRHRRAASRRQPRRHRHVRRRRRRPRIRRRLRSGDRQRSVAILDDAEARRAGIGNVAGQGPRSSGGHDVDDGRVRSGARHRLLDRRQSRSGSHTATIVSATTSTPTPSSRSTRRPAR